MNITSISFTDPPVFHQFPAIYENLGLRQVSSYIEQPFKFGYKLGKAESTGHAGIRFFQQQGDFLITTPKKIPGFGTVRLEQLKSLLLEQTKPHFIEKLKSEPPKQKVIHTYFRRTRKETG
ncbi:hypothetical protein ACFFHM_01625 [Halalkalibacter kiskunsagensis]|uniref:Uncharacterized protein n=1 Tax=Halalkalibacter kiskunsagensis TaxID=1548599 RepID=A0ABV6K8J9_9BACI